MTTEQHSCPARVHGFGPWERTEGADRWERRRWGTRLSRWWERVAHGAGGGNYKRPRAINDFLQSRRMFALRKRFPRLMRLVPSFWTIGGTHWPADISMAPRSCSFCGCSHPDDVMKLIDAGWRVDVCDSGAKCYVRPASGQSPVPPVKVKTYHCTKEHVARLNTARLVYDPTTRSYR